MSQIRYFMKLSDELYKIKWQLHNFISADQHEGAYSVSKI